MTKKIAVLVWSLRNDSYNKKIAKQLIALAPATLEMKIVSIDMPLFNEDLDNDTPPQAWTDFRNTIKDADGVVFVTPEYNRNTTAVLKNALDVASRPWGQNVWAWKPGAVISVSMSPIGGYAANHAIRQTAVVLDIPMLQQPEAYIKNIHTLFNKEGELEEDTKGFLQRYINAYAAWVEKIKVD